MNPTITRSQFVNKFANKELDLSKVNQQVRNELWSASRATLHGLEQADLNNDGKISGVEEAKALFKYVDSFDQNGSGSSFTHHVGGGSTAALTKSGKLYNVLSLQLERPEITTPTRANSHVEDSSFGNALSQGGANSIAEKMGGHLRSIRNTGVGTYFGSHSEMNDMSTRERQNWIDERAIQGTNPPKASELKQSSCIQWAMENVEAAYTKAGKPERWAEIKRIVRRDGLRGTTLAKELQKDGWEAVYWNPDVNKSADGSGEHTYSAKLVRNNKPYYKIDIDHSVTNYRPAEGSRTTKDMNGIDKLDQVPFFFGLARGGSHTFVGRKGKVNEFHWNDMPDDKNAIEETPLKDWDWLSGVIMVPPGTWPKE